MHEIEPCPFVRSIAGMQGQYLCRHNKRHEDEAANAIKRRNHPFWSRMVDSFEVAA